MEGMEKEKKKPLDLDFETLLSSRSDDEDPPELFVATTIDDEQPQPQSLHAMNSDMESLQRIHLMSDRELDNAISRKQLSYTSLGPKLPDKGAKLFNILKRLKDEKELRSLQPRKPSKHVQWMETNEKLSEIKDANGCQMLKQSKKFGAPNGCRLDVSQSSETFLRNKPRKNGEFLQNKGGLNRPSSRECAFKTPRCLSLDRSSHVSVSDYKNGRVSPISSSFNIYNFKRCFTQRGNASPVLSSRESKRHKAQTVDLVDVEESRPTQKTKLANRLLECMKEAKIYYPSRGDTEAVEICYADLKCLDPDAYLSSTIMNFYIRYLQQVASLTGRAEHDYHFFNTYFYQKLIEAVSKRGEKDSFSKFRRWWKGVNLFRKACVLIPIHEGQHWSLVIICIPDLEEDSGPIILHLDSLGLHCSKSIFSNIKSFLSNEWDYLNQDGAPPPDVPIPHRIWEHLPRKIFQKVLAVPQQRNASDCGLFVLFFMERFMEDAPQRLKMIDLAKFGKRWFNPEDASRLREKIGELLIREFQHIDVESLNAMDTTPLTAR